MRQSQKSRPHDKDQGASVATTRADLLDEGVCVFGVAACVSALRQSHGRLLQYFRDVAHKP